MNKVLLNRTDHEGAKGPIFFGKDRVLVYLRDNKTDYFPGYYGLPGGGKENNETVFETFRRESKEEFGLDISLEQIKFVKQYPHTRFPGELAYFLVAELPQEDEDKVKFGLEGKSYEVIDVDDYLSSPRGIPIFQNRVKEFINSGNNQV